jgi:hypothetical protein
MKLSLEKYRRKRLMVSLEGKWERIRNLARRKMMTTLYQQEFKDKKERDKYINWLRHMIQEYRECIFNWKQELAELVTEAEKDNAKVE